MFDFGRGAIDGLIKKRVDLKEIQNIFISHMHSDHFSEIGSFLGWVIDEPSLLKVEHKVKIFGPRGIKKAVKRLLKAFQIYATLKRRPKGRIEVIEIKSRETIDVNGLRIEGIEVDHAQGKDKFKALSYRISYNKKVICYSGDTPSCQGIRDACRNADLAIIEATLPKKANVKSHMTGEDLGLIAKEEKILKLVVTHVDKDYLSYVKRHIRENYHGKIILAKDMMEIKV